MHHNHTRDWDNDFHFRDKSGDRDIFNERPTREEQTVASSAPAFKSGPSPVANAATIHTTVGDMHLRLFPQQAPKAVENFVGHARSGYYEGVIFHRVIPKFMIQTGDPLGDGTGGTSIWGYEFEDEFSDDLRHDRYVLHCLYLPVRSFLMLILPLDRTPSAWPTPVQAPTVRSFSSLQLLLLGWTRSIRYLGVSFRAWKWYTISKTRRPIKRISPMKISKLLISMSSRRNPNVSCVLTFSRCIFNIAIMRLGRGLLEYALWRYRFESRMRVYVVKIE